MVFFCFLKSQLTHLVEINSHVSMWSDQYDLAIYKKKKKEHSIFKLRYIQQLHILVLIFPFSLNFTDHRSKEHVPKIAMVERLVNISLIV